MGKKTTAMIKSIKEKLKEKNKLGVELIQIKDTDLPKAQKEYNQANDAYHKYYNGKGWQTTSTENERAMEADKLFQKLRDHWADKYEEVERLTKELNTGVQDYFKLGDDIEKLVDNLETYVKTKKATKEHWWQKKSVASAENFIKSMRATDD